MCLENFNYDINLCLNLWLKLSETCITILIHVRRKYNCKYAYYNCDF